MSEVFPFAQTHELYFLSFAFVRLQIEKEELFVCLSEMLAAAMSWEERTREILAVESKLEDFEDAIRFLSVLIPFRVHF